MIFKNYKDYCKKTQKPYMYYRYWKHAMWRIKVNVFYINLLKYFGHDITKPSRITKANSNVLPQQK